MLSTRLIAPGARALIRHSTRQFRTAVPLAVDAQATQRGYVLPPSERDAPKLEGVSRNPNFGPNGEPLYKVNEHGWYEGGDGLRYTPVSPWVKEQQARFQVHDGKPLWLKGGKLDYYLYYGSIVALVIGMIHALYNAYLMVKR